MHRDGRAAKSASPTSPPYPGYPPPSPYHRRTSPPGSPAPKKCCFREKHSYPKETFLCCCYACPGTKATSVLATIGICVLVLAYTILGAFTFMALEGGWSHPETAVAASKPGPGPSGGERKSIPELRSQTVDRLWSITENLNILYRENWTRLAAEEVMIFQNELVEMLRQNGGRVGGGAGGGGGGGTGSKTGGSGGAAGGGAGAGGSGRGGTEMFFYGPSHKWSFSFSFLYSLTLITTIGYGSVSPHTPWGKLVTIIYALIGIPLMLLYLSTTGEVLARVFRKLYGKLCGPHQTPPHCPCSSNIRVPVSLCLLIVLVYVCSGAVLFHKLENWSILEGSYFCFTSLGTIGFGDLVPHSEDASLCICSAYILTGMALVAMCFSLVQEEVVSLFRYVATTCGGKEKVVTGYQEKMQEQEDIAMALVSS